MFYFGLLSMLYQHVSQIISRFFQLSLVVKSFVLTTLLCFGTQPCYEAHDDCYGILTRNPVTRIGLVTKGMMNAKWVWLYPRRLPKVDHGANKEYLIKSFNQLLICKISTYFTLTTFSWPVSRKDYNQSLLYIMTSIKILIDSMGFQM